MVLDLEHLGTISFKSRYFLRLLKGDWNPFTPNVINITDKFIEYKRRNKYLISTDTETYHFQSVTGVYVDKHFMGATIRILMTGTPDEIRIEGFKKQDADLLKNICLQQIAKNTPRGVIDTMSRAITSAINAGQMVQPVQVVQPAAYAQPVQQPAAEKSSSVVQDLLELKKMLEQGLITNEDYQRLKDKIVNS